MCVKGVVKLLHRLRSWTEIKNKTIKQKNPKHREMELSTSVMCHVTPDPPAPRCYVTCDELFLK